jgi:hypothetical protein
MPHPLADRTTVPRSSQEPQPSARLYRPARRPLCQALPPAPPRPGPPSRRRDEQHPYLPGQAERISQQHGGVLACGAVDASLQVTNRPGPRPAASASSSCVSRASVRNCRNNPAKLRAGSATLPSSLTRPPWPCSASSEPTSPFGRPPSLAAAARRTIETNTELDDLCAATCLVAPVASRTESASIGNSTARCFCSRCVNDRSS